MLVGPSSGVGSVQEATKPLCNTNAFTDGQMQHQGSSKVPTSAVVRHVPDVKDRRRAEPSAQDKTFSGSSPRQCSTLGRATGLSVIATSDATSDATAPSHAELDRHRNHLAWALVALTNDEYRTGRNVDCDMASERARCSARMRAIRVWPRARRHRLAHINNPIPKAGQCRAVKHLASQ